MKKTTILAATGYMHKLGSKRARWPGYVDSTYKCAV
jgi:hypothetical protein